MNDYTTEPAPPAYIRDSVAPQWKIRNARYRSTFVTKDEPDVLDFRQHLDCMKDSFLDSTRGIGSPASPHGEPQILSVEYSQAFDDVAHLMCEYQACLQKIKPLLEEDVLFLLLSQYAQKTRTRVYMEIRRPSDIQVFDSELPEPYHTADIQDHLVHASGVLNAKIPQEHHQCSPTQTICNATQPLSDNVPYATDPPDPLTNSKKSTVTVNFPAMHIVRPIDVSLMDRATGDPPAYSGSHSAIAETVTVTDWGTLPEKLQPPAFSVHRCHHSGVEHGGEDSAFELPVGMPEAIHHLTESREHFYHVGFHIGNRSRQCCPVSDGGIQAFKCYLTESDTWVYLTVIRTGDMLGYNCFVDEEIWAACHPEHEECQGCPTSGQLTTMRHSPGARVGLDHESQSTQKAFILAVEHGECSASLLLLRNGADVNAHCGYFGHALQIASWLSDYNMMELLLNNGANVNALGGHYGNALQATSWTGNEQTVNLLLDRNASVNAQGGYFGNALQGASWAGNKRIVEILIGQGADVNAQGGFYGNALQAASSRGCLQVVKVLLRAGADVNARGGHFGSALQAALNYGHLRVAGLLQHSVWQGYLSSVLF